MFPKKIDIQGLRIAQTEKEYRKSYYKIRDSHVTSMIRFNGLYVYVLSQCIGWNNAVVTHVWHPENYKGFGRDGKFVFGLYRNESRWELHMTSNTGIIDQNISMFDDWNHLKKFISSQWEKGYDITDLTTHEGKYYIVTSLGLNLTQGWSLDNKFPTEYANKAYDQGKILTEVAPINDSYLWIFSANTGFDDLKLIHGPNNDKIQKIRIGINSDEKYDGYSLASIKEVNNKLLYIFIR